MAEAEAATFEVTERKATTGEGGRWRCDGGRKVSGTTVVSKCLGNVIMLPCSAAIVGMGMTTAPLKCSTTDFDNIGLHQ